jgi:hypothetical protein
MVAMVSPVWVKTKVKYYTLFNILVVHTGFVANHHTMCIYVLLFGTTNNLTINWEFHFVFVCVCLCVRMYVPTFLYGSSQNVEETLYGTGHETNRGLFIC